MEIVSPKFISFLSRFGMEISTIALWPFIISRKEMSDSTRHHEQTHLAQQLELWLIGFYALYLYYYLQGRKNEDRRSVVETLRGREGVDAARHVPI